MRSIISLLLLLPTTVFASKPAALIEPSDLVGSWRCGPVVMQGQGFTVTATIEVTREMGGTFVSHDTTTIEAQGRTPMRLKDRSSGTWQLKDGIISTKILSAEFLSSSDPAVTKEAGQKAQDDQLKKKSTYQNRVLEHTGSRYRTFPVNAMHKEAEVELTCERIQAMAGSAQPQR